MSVYLFSYNPHSQSAKFLAQAMGIRRIKHHGSRANPDIIINWGSSDLGLVHLSDQIINWPGPVAYATNKLTSFKILQEAGVSIPPFTTNTQEAESWLEQGKTVVARRLVSGAEGRGIDIYQPGPGRLNIIERDYPLYTQYIPKRKEFRYHVVNGQVIDIQQKVRKRNATGERNFYIRNTANGFVFCRGGITPPSDGERESVSAVMALGLDFGAVDVIWNERQNKSFVLEVNTAPGIEGTTVQRYKEALSALCNLR